MASRTESELAWAERTAMELLSTLEARWRHTLRVVERAQSFRDVLDRHELDVLLAAGYLHDVGYAPDLADVGFHPLDGARFVRKAGHERLAGLVAHHSASDAEAEERGFGDELAEFLAEDSVVARALTYCDLTTGPNGEELGVSARLLELGDRLGKDDPTVRAVRREATRLAAVVEEMESLLAAVSAEQPAFDGVARAAFRLYGERRYNEALTLARDASERFPDRRATTSFWIACLLSVMGEHDDAVAALADGIERGEWWSEGRLRGDSDLAPLQGREDFEAVVDAARRGQAANPSSPGLEVLRPSTQPRGFVVALHGAGGTIESVAAQWQHAPELGYAVGIPLSSQRSSSDDDRRAWDDAELAAHEIADARDRLARKLELDPQSAIFAGFSQGGRRVVEWALMGALPDVRRFIGVASGVDQIRPEDVDRHLASAAQRGIRAAFVVGDGDFVLESVKHFHETLRAAGIASRLDVVSGVGHDYPPDFRSRLAALLAWVDAPAAGR